MGMEGRTEGRKGLVGMLVGSNDQPPFSMFCLSSKILQKF